LWPKIPSFLENCSWSAVMWVGIQVPCSVNRYWCRIRECEGLMLGFRLGGPSAGAIAKFYAYFLFFPLVVIFPGCTCCLCLRVRGHSNMSFLPSSMHLSLLCYYQILLLFLFAFLALLKVFLHGHSCSNWCFCGLMTTGDHFYFAIFLCPLGNDQEIMASDIKHRYQFSETHRKHSINLSLLLSLLVLFLSQRIHYAVRFHLFWFLLCPNIVTRQKQATIFQIFKIKCRK
jgi:hypothetical protein